MSTRPLSRLAIALPLFALALNGCGNGFDAQPRPQPATRTAALRDAPAPGDACGTLERPCVLEGIRVGAAAE
jgi:hypothetical protein